MVLLSLRNFAYFIGRGYFSIIGKTEKFLLPTGEQCPIIESTEGKPIRKEVRDMAYGTTIEVWGDFALFSRPELKVERMSYDVITPSAARGLIEAVYWHPGMRYVIDRIHVLNPISFTSVRRNEVKSKALVSAIRSYVGGAGGLPYIDRSADIQQRASVVLTDVHYVIEAHFEITAGAGPHDNPGKFCDILRRRLSRGQCYSQPYFGTREFPAHFRLYEGETPPHGAYSEAGERDLGLMLYDMDYSDSSDITPMFFRAVMRNGVIDVSGSEVFR